MLRHEEGWATFPDHHLSWRKSELNSLKKELFDLIEKKSFPTDCTELNGFTRFIYGQTLIQMEVFNPNLYLPFPLMKTPILLLIPNPEQIENRHNLEQTFQKLLSENKISYILTADPDWSKTPLFSRDLNLEKLSESEFKELFSVTNDNLVRDIEGLFWDFLQKNDRITEYFTRHEIGKPQTKLYLYLARKIPDKNQ
jgi:hypothetical protein